MDPHTRSSFPGVARPLLWLVLALAAGLGAACARIAIERAPEKTASEVRTARALEADDRFWSTLHGARYEALPDVLEALTAAYLEDPRDAVTAAHLGFAHVWRLSERARLGEPRASVTDHAVLARRYFAEARRLDPSDARIQGFHGSLLLIEGTLHDDEELRRRGYYALLDAIDAWPEFNYFTAGYAMSSLPHDSPRFREALDYQWRNLDVCAGRRIDRQQPSYAEFMERETREGEKRVCWNSWIAPHNFEGFFLNLGDMLVKAGDVETAVTVYGMARLSNDYARWPHREVLETRIREARENVEPFRQATASADEPRILVRSPIACTACHQAASAD